MMTRIKHLYVHVPFCRSICFYCDFCHRIYDEKLADRWLDRLAKEITEKCNDRYETIYIGGGTPTCLNDRQLERLFELIAPYTGQKIEYTIEANPESLDLNKIRLMKRYGVDRVSLGVQSSDDRILASLNRHHSFDDVKRKIVLLKQNGITNISVDLMYSLPGQDMKILEQTLHDILALDVPHISLYSLTVEEDTVFGKRGLDHLDDDTEADMYELITAVLQAAGYIHYEVANFAKAGHESRHNLGYWNYEDFLGISAGAASKIGKRRYTNTSSLERYLKEDDALDEDLHLEKEDLMFENIMMSLRTIYGLDIAAFNERYGCDLFKEYPKGVDNPAISVIDGHLVCTDPALLNRVLLDFMK